MHLYGRIICLLLFLSQGFWWGHLKNKISIKGGTKALILKEKCKDSVSSTSSKQHANLDEEIQEPIIRRRVDIKRL